MIDDGDGRRIPHVIGSRLERESPDSEPLALDVAVEVSNNAVHKSSCLVVVYGFNRFQNSHGSGMFTSGLNQRSRVFGKAAAAISDSGKEKGMSDPCVCCKSFPYQVDI